MREANINEAYTGLIKIVVALITGMKGITLVDFSNQLEKLVNLMVESGFASEVIKQFLAEIEQSLKTNDLILLYDKVWLLLEHKGVEVIAETE